MNESTVFRVSAGLYAGGLLWTPVVLSGAPAIGVSLVALAGGAAGGAILAGPHVSRDRIEALGERRLRLAALWSVPLTYAVATAALAAGAGPFPERAALVPGAIGTALVLAGAVAMLAVSRTRRAARALEESETRVRLPPTFQHQQLRRLRPFLLAATVVPGAGMLWIGPERWTSMLTVLSGGVLALAPSLGQDVTITDRGVVVRTRLDSRLLEWDDFRGYYVGTRLTLVRGVWWRQALEFDCDDLEDRGTITDALDRHLPQTEP